jgi:predicted Ser/Thr protein kinase
MTEQELRKYVQSNPQDEDAFQYYLSVIRFNYESMTEQELRNYVRRNPQDEDAFQYYLSIIRSRPGVLCTTDEEIEAELKRRINQQP